MQNEIRSHYSVPQQVAISLSTPQPSDIPGYDRLVVTFTHAEKKTTIDFLVSKDRKTLARLETFDISQDLMSKINVTNRPVRGNAAATVTIVNFDDFQCPFCSRMHATLFPGLLKTYGDRVKFIYKDYPLLEIHPWAMHAAIDANCLAAKTTKPIGTLPITSTAIKRRSPARTARRRSPIWTRSPRSRARNTSWTRTNFKPALPSRMRQPFARR